MVVAVFAVHVFVGNFFCCGSPHIQHFDGKAQGLARQRVVAVEVNDRAFDFQHGENDLLSIFAAAL